MKKSIILFTLFVISFSCKKNSTLSGFENAAVVSAYPEATESGLKILQKGGNVIDAAVATYFTLAVVYPQAGNIGGGGFLVYRTESGEVYTLDFREVAPLAAFETMYLDKTGFTIENLSTKGHKAVGVPGSVIGMYEAHQKWGSLPWSNLLEDAIYFAENGYILTALQANELNKVRDDFEKYNRGNYCFCQKERWNDGDTLIQKDLANTIKRIAELGADEMRIGLTAKLLLQEMEKGNGIISSDDLEAYTATERKPLFTSYKDLEIYTMPLPSAGGFTLIQLLGMAENFDFNDKDYLTPKAIHLMAEMERLAFSDRVSHLGDPEFIKTDFEKLLDKKYLSEKAKTISENKAGKSINLESPKSESEQTTHFSIADKKGNAVAVTTTLNSSFGSKVCVEGAGFLLNNEMDDFSIAPGIPNQFGLVGSVANKIEPRKKMLSSMTPTIVTKGGKLFLVLGTPGGTTIPTSVFQVFMNVVHFEKNIQDAVNAPRFHHQWIPDNIYYEEDYQDTLNLNKLKKMGHQLKKRESIGRFDAIHIDSKGKLHTGADRRGNDYGNGF